VRYCHGYTYCAPQDKAYTLLGVGKYQPMSEDCLTLNVVAPEEPSDEPLPVMFFIHRRRLRAGQLAHSGL
jgi:para-nitrobenzyl esterase